MAKTTFQGPVKSINGLSTKTLEQEFLLTKEQVQLSTGDTSSNTCC